MNKWDSLIKAFEITITNSTFEELQNCIFEKIRIDGRDGQVRDLKGFKYGSILPKVTSDRLEPTYFITYKNLNKYELTNKQFNGLTQFINKQLSKKSKMIINNDWNEIDEIIKNEGK